MSEESSTYASGLQKIGGAICVYGLISAALWFVHMNLIILMWMDLAGPEIGWAIRGAMILLGGGMWVAGAVMKR